MPRWIIFVAFTACGSDVGSPDGGIIDASSDATVNDAPNDGATDGGADADASFDAHADSKPAVVLHLKCAEGDQCEAGTPVCCATLDFGSDCVLDEVTSACAAAAQCPTTLQPFCTSTETVRFCDQTADCTEPQYTKCCTFQITGQSQSLVMCASQSMADAVDASCVP